MTTFESGTGPAARSGLYYQASGGSSPLAPVAMLGLGAVAAAGLGLIYGYLTEYNPIVYFNLLATLVYGALLGAAVMWGGNLGKVRAPWLGLTMGAAVGLAGLYTDWAVWLHAAAGRGNVATPWLPDPRLMLQLMAALAEKGAWSMKSYTPTGVVLYILWLLEALVIVGLAALIPWSNAKSKPFCEGCGVWGKKEVSGLQLGAITNAPELRSRLENGDIKALSELGPAGDDAYTELTLIACPQCRLQSWLELHHVVVTVDKKGKREAKKTQVLENLILMSPVLDSVRVLAPGPNDPSPRP